MGINFTRWLANVDQHLLRMVGLTHRDIADQTWRDWFEDDVSPVHAAREALFNEGWEV